MPSRLSALLSVPPERQYGRTRASGSSALQRRGHRLDEGALERCVEGDVAVHDLHLDVLARELADGRQQLVLVAGQEPAVDGGRRVCGMTLCL